VPRVKGSLNRIVDDMIHPRGRPTDLASMIVDEALHSLIEGGFRPDKFLRYTLLPQTQFRVLPFNPTRKQKRKCRKPHTQVREVRCEGCGQYVPFGSETWIDGKPYCSKCALEELARKQAIAEAYP